MECTGHLRQDLGDNPFAYAYVNLLPAGQPADVVAWTPGHNLTLSVNNHSPGVTYRICLESANISDGDFYCAEIQPDTSGWQDITIYFPDVSVEPSSTQFSQSGSGATVPWGSCRNQITALRLEVVPSTSGPVDFDIDVDDITLGHTATKRHNVLKVASAFGVSVATVQECNDLNLDEAMTWVILAISKHCGCSPGSIYAKRATMTWGEICASYSLDWSTTLAEAESLAAAAGLEPYVGDPDMITQNAVNQSGVRPTATPAPYVPGGQLVPGPSVPGCL